MVICPRITLKFGISLPKGKTLMADHTDLSRKIETLQVWAFVRTFQYYLGVRIGPFEGFIEQKKVSDEVMFRVLSSARSNLRTELCTYLMYMLDDPSMDEEPVLES